MIRVSSETDGLGAFQHLEDPLQAPSQAPRLQVLGIDGANRGEIHIAYLVLG
jgi:hypothetical protein